MSDNGTKGLASSRGRLSNSPRRVLIVDDHPIVRQGLCRLMENEDDLFVCGEASTVNDALSAVGALKPDVIVADISLDQSDGLELVRSIRNINPHLPILMLSMHDEAIYANRMLAAGANGYIMKQAASELFLVAVRKVLDGQIYLSDAFGAAKTANQAAPSISTSLIERLSNRELQILHMIGKGMSTRETASSLSLSIKTVESHRQRVKRKLQLDTGAQLVRYAVSWFTSGEADSRAATEKDPPVS